MIRSRKIRRVLIANRGEIAVRIIRAARSCGCESVALYSDADEGVMHVRLADKKVRLPGNSARETYLNSEKIIEAAIQSGADAVHPGYGFLAENADFAAAVTKAGLCFVGPQSRVIALMGDKARARAVAVECGVPVLPGTGAGSDRKTIEEFCREVGFPVIIKAVAGGSGRGMRVVQNIDELDVKLAEAQGEAESAFKNREVILEKYIPRPRHIEVQVFGDELGNIVHFGERECSVQRRHQKIIEEAPAPKLDAKLRESICEAAVKLVRSVEYTGAGTVEFLVDDATPGGFYFLEMNTRIQVEHAVTEAVCGIDLVALQLRVAAGEALGIEQEQIRLQGHAFEFRIYAEDPRAEFKPTNGKLLYICRAAGAGVREDSWVEAGSVVSSYYDSLLSKLTVWGSSREEAIERSRAALSEYLIEGVETTLDFHRWIVEQEDFKSAAIDVNWIARNYRGQTQPAIVTGPFNLPPLKPGGKS